MKFKCKRVISVVLAIMMMCSCLVSVSAAFDSGENLTVSKVNSMVVGAGSSEDANKPIDGTFDIVVDIIEFIHDFVGRILSVVGEECPFCDKVHGQVEDDEPIDDPSKLDTDKDGISNADEALYGTSVNNADTDGDSFTDYEELFAMGTDPLTPDKNDIDTDEDGLTDYDEVKLYGTDINASDSDGDTLSDYDEVNKHGTDPNKKDTDGDGLDDNFEIEKGFNPLKKKSDGLNVDSEIKVEQEIDEESISEVLLTDDNVATPGLKGKVAGDLSKKAFIEASTDSSLEDNRAIIGYPVLLDCDDCDDDLSLEFDLSDYEGDLENLSVCKLNEDGGIVPVESSRDDSIISCDAETDTTFFVMDIDAFLKALGIDLDSYKTKMFSKKARSAEIAGDKVKGQADIVFAIDTTGSMYDVINNVIYNVTDFTERLSTEYNVKVNYALIDYRDLEEDGPGTTKVIKNGSSNWFTDVDTYVDALNTLYADGGGDGPECSVDALETARRLDFRKSASKFVILITDADYKVLNDYGIESLSEEADLLQKDGINTSVVCPSGYSDLYGDVYNKTGGIYANIYGDFSNELLKLADLIGEETSDGEWVILKHGYRYVKLDAIPEAGSVVDTDEDGLVDYVELGNKITVDLTLLIKARLAFNGVPFESYDGKTAIEVYDSIADPTLYDTDGDGFNDKEDPTPWKAAAFKNMEYYIKKSYGSSPSITMLVKQPIENSRTAVNFGEGDMVGHTFIMLSDGNGNISTFGFYPSYEGTSYTDYLDYTLANIYSRGLKSTNGVVYNDSEHEYSVTYSAQISSEQYENVCNYVSKNSSHKYNLQSYNCTTFAVEAFAVADSGIKSIVKRHLWSIPWWAGGLTFTVFYPFGYDPGDAGEDIRMNASEYTVKETIKLTDGTSVIAVVPKH